MEHPEKNVIRLGWISLLNDIGSETIIRLIPFYISGVLGASMAIVGTIEGLAETTSTLLKPTFGKLSDRLGKRKNFVLLGYVLSSAARPLLAFAGTPLAVGLLRVGDRFGKAVRTAPRDALISVTQSKQTQGMRFGMNRAMDTAGAIVGIGLFALFIYWKSGNGETFRLTSLDWKILCLASLIPSLICVAILIWGIAEVPSRKPPEGTALAPFPAVLKRYLFSVGLFGLANSSDAFILLRSKDMGFSLLQILEMIILLNLFSSMTAIPATLLSDRFGRKTLILAGWVIYAGVYGGIGLGFGSHSVWVYGGLLAVYGLFYGFTEGVEKAWIADLTGPHERGRAYGWFGLITGLSALPASAVFGWAWDRFGDHIPFLGGAVLALIAALALLLIVPKENAQKVSDTFCAPSTL
jgi:MFS family permease